MSYPCELCAKEADSENRYCINCANNIVIWFEDMEPAALDKAIECVKDELIGEQP